jgi:Flp pilus assembly protein TadD
MLLPVAGIIQVGGQAHADRYTYLPQIGIDVAVTWMAAEWGAKWQVQRAAFGGLVTGVLAVLMVCAWQQTEYWQDSETLWLRTIVCTRDNYLAHYNLGNFLWREGSVDDAITHYRKALQIKPDYADAQFNLGNALQQNGQTDEAVTHFQKALEINPNNAGIHLNLGLCFYGLGRMEEAISQYQTALHIEPADPAAQNDLAWLLATCPQASLRNGNKAVELARRADDLVGGENPVILHTLAAAYAEAGRFSEAVETAQRALYLAEAQSNTTLAGQLQSEMKLFQAGSPFHTPAQTH